MMERPGSPPAVLREEPATHLRRSTAVTASVVSVALGAVAAGAAIARALRGRTLRVAVAGESMTPALQPDDFLVLHAGPPRADEAFGQVVAVYDPRPRPELVGAEAGRRLLLKRIVGLPGESLRVGGGVQVNGQLLDEPYASGETPLEQHRGINRLDDDQYFLLGDNRGASTDSRDFGPVRAGDIVGTVALRYWPLERFGRLPRPARAFVPVEEHPHDHGPNHGHDHGHEHPSTPVTQPLPWIERPPEA